MSELVLTLRETLPQRLDASALRPDELAGLSRREIERLALGFEDGTSVLVGDLFDVSGAASNRLHIVGNTSQCDRLASRMKEGHIQIEGDIGHGLGEQMSGGTIIVHRHAGHFVGRSMRGGKIVVHGNVGNGAGSGTSGAKKGMTGGEIVVLGNAGAETGVCLRRGVIAVAGTVGPHALRSALAGTLIAFGDVAEAAARWSKRASLIAMSDVGIPAGYAYACTFQPGFIRVLLTHLQREYSLPVTTEHMERSFERYCGDFAELGRGEILRAVKD